MTAIRASFSDFRIVKGRKVAQLVMEVPIEQADAALRALGGVPSPDVDRWVGIAPLTEEAATRQPENAPRRNWDALTYCQQAGIRCSDPEFQAWLSVTDEIEAAAHVREHCQVDSRTELDRTRDAAERWRQMDRDFRARHMAA